MAQEGAGGGVVYATVLLPPEQSNNPSGLRLVSLVSSEQRCIPVESSSAITEQFSRSSVVDCNTGAMGMFVDAYQNTGYLEFTQDS